jgi:diaminopimelate decarboxylase
MGGGLGIDYEKGSIGISPAALASAIRPMFKGRKMTLILEPGRSLVANAGILLTKGAASEKCRRKGVCCCGCRDE